MLLARVALVVAPALVLCAALLLALALLTRELLLLGDLLRLSGRPREALPHLEEAYAIWSKTPPKNPRELADVEVAIATSRSTLR